MKPLRPIVTRSGGALAGVVAETLQAMESGLTLLERGFAAGETLVDILAIDAAHRLVTVVVELDADAAAVVRALEAAAWCRDNWALVGRLFAGADLDLTEPARPVLVARHLGDRALRLLRALGAVAPTAFECQVFEGTGERYVSYERATHGGSREEGRRGAPDAAEPAAPTEARPGRRPRAAAEPPERSESDAAERAQSMIARLEALRLRQAFQS
jgi:hypothetical protein